MFIVFAIGFVLLATGFVLGIGEAEKVGSHPFVSFFCGVVGAVLMVCALFFEKELDRYKSELEEYKKRPSSDSGS